MRSVYFTMRSPLPEPRFVRAHTKLASSSVNEGFVIAAAFSPPEFAR